MLQLKFLLRLNKYLPFSYNRIMLLYLIGVFYLNKMEILSSLFYKCLYLKNYNSNHKHNNLMVVYN